LSSFSEGLKYPDGTLFAVAQSHDVYAYTQLGGAAPRLAEMIKKETGHKLHWSVVDYIQRAARHLASRVDVEQAYAVGKAAVEGVVAGHRSFHAGDPAGNQRSLPLVDRTRTARACGQHRTRDAPATSSRRTVMGSPRPAATICGR
jgi:6-phosphofructokinase